MGYTTEFRGQFTFNKPLTNQQKEYINKFSHTRRMKRDSKKLEDFMLGMFSVPNIPLVKGYGIEGEYYVGGLGFAGQENDGSVIDHNNPPSTQPGLWCLWITDGKSLYWDGTEKFYNYTSWLKYMIQHFFGPWGIVLNGKVDFRGENWDDQGSIIVEDNEITKIGGGENFFGGDNFSY